MAAGGHPPLAWVQGSAQVQSLERLDGLVQVKCMLRNRPGPARLTGTGQGPRAAGPSGDEDDADCITGKIDTTTINRPVIAIGGLSIRHALAMHRIHMRRIQGTLLWTPVITLCHREEQRPKATLLRPLPYRRLGEALRPGPTIRMPGDGHCLYHALGWWAGMTQSQIRPNWRMYTSILGNPSSHGTPETLGATSKHKL